MRDGGTEREEDIGDGLREEKRGGRYERKVDPKREGGGWRKGEKGRAWMTRGGRDWGGGWKEEENRGRWIMERREKLRSCFYGHSCFDLAVFEAGISQ